MEDAVLCAKRLKTDQALSEEEKLVLVVTRLSSSGASPRLLFRGCFVAKIILRSSMASLSAT
jgi:hypothetical protein